MPKNGCIQGSIEITLQGPEDTMRLHTAVDSTVEDIKEVWREYAGCRRDLSLFCIFDGFLLEDAATLVGLGVVGGDTIMVFPPVSPSLPVIPPVKMIKRNAKEISVGLNVLFGEEEELPVLIPEKCCPNVHVGPLCSERMAMLEKILDDLIQILERHDAKVTGRFDMNEIKKACFAHVYEEGRQLEDRDLIRLLPQEDDQIVAEVFGVLKHFRDTNWTLPGAGHIEYDIVFIGPERNADWTNYLAFPPTVKLCGLDWKTSLRDLLESYREYTNFNIPDEVDHLWFNNEMYLLDERVYDVIINGLSQIPSLPSHQLFSFQFDISETEDLRRIDDLVSFIEGDEYGNEPKKKKKKRKKKVQQAVHTESSIPLIEETKALKVEPPTKLVKDNPSKESENDVAVSISSLNEVNKINFSDHKENLMSRVETLVDVKVSIESGLFSEKQKLAQNDEKEQNLAFLKEKDQNLIMSINRTDQEVSNISNGISSCDSEIHDLEMRLQRSKLLKETLTDKRNIKYEKLKTLEEEKRQLTQKINVDSQQYHEERTNTLQNIESLSSYLAGTEQEIVENLSRDGSAKCPLALQYLESEIRKLEVTPV